MTFRTSLAALATLISGACVTGPESTFRVAEFGAIGDGRTLATTAIQQAIDACAASGGGLVVVPSGTFLTGSLRLRSDVLLHLTVGAKLLASTDLEQYPTGRLIWAQGASRVGIEGRGIIDGQVSAYQVAERQALPRPDPLIEFDGCNGISVRGVRIESSPADTIAFSSCDVVTVEEVEISNVYDEPEVVGLEVNGSRNLLVRGCRIASSDAAVRLEADRPDMVVENIIVSGCVLSSQTAAFQIGPGSAGAVRRCVLTDTVIHDSRSGIALMMRQGGSFEGIRFDDITIDTGARRDRGSWAMPILATIDRQTPGAAWGRIRGIAIGDIGITTGGSSLISGQPDRPIEELTLDRISVRVHDPSDSEAATPPRTRASTPQPGTGRPIVAAHLIVEHAAGLRISDLRITVDPPLAGPARRLLWGQDLVDATLSGIWGEQSGDPAVLPALELVDCRRVVLRDSIAAPGTESYLRLVGERTANVHLFGNNLGQAATPLLLDGADRGAVTVDGRPSSGR